jgi:hypothetical protein
MKEKKLKWEKPKLRNLGSCLSDGCASCYKGNDNYSDCRNGNKDILGCSQGHKYIR